MSVRIKYFESIRLNTLRNQEAIDKLITLMCEETSLAELERIHVKFYNSLKQQTGNTNN